MSHLGPHGLQFAELAQNWVGYQPRTNWSELIDQSEEMKRKLKAALMVSHRITSTRLTLL
jgi:hypothetical protein